MSFVEHGSLETVFQDETTNPTPTEWTADYLREELQARGVWTASLPGNIECWYPQVLSHVDFGTFTFTDFVDEFAAHQPFDFGKTLKRLLDTSPTESGGWPEGAMG